MPLHKMPGWEVVPPAPAPEPADDPVWISAEPWTPYGSVGFRSASEVIAATYARAGRVGWLAGEDQIEAPPRLEPPGVHPETLGFPAGTYDFSAVGRAGDILHGRTRWRMPGTLSVYDASGSRQWTYTEELSDGTLADVSGRKWVPNQAELPDVVRGRYTLDRDANQSMAGEVRWLHRSARTLYVDAACRHRTNSGMQLLPDGTWRSRGGMVWEPV